MADARLQAAGNGFQDAALKITQVRGKNYLCPEVAGNLRLMAMVKYAVRLQANFTEAGSGLHRVWRNQFPLHLA